jgi:hypothetical protein
LVTIFHRNINAIILSKNWLACHLGIFVETHLVILVSRNETVLSTFAW